MPSDAARGDAELERGVVAAVEGIVERLGGGIGDLGDRLADHLFREVPELTVDPEIRGEVRDAAVASLSGWVEMVRRELPPTEVAPPPGVLAIARTWVLRGAPLPALLRAFHLGHGFFIREVVAGIPMEETAPEVLGSVLERLLAVSFAYIDALTDHVADVYASERARFLRSADAVRGEAARTLIAGEPLDVDAASRALGYELRRWHVAMVLWAELGEDGEDPLSRLEEVAGEIAAEIGGTRPLLVPAGRGLLWAWAGTSSAPPEAAFAGLRARRLEGGVSAALGEPGEDTPGFARSHREALEARRVAALTRGSGSITLYTEVELLSLLAADPERAGRFVRAELGALAADDSKTARLRTTLRIFLDEGRSFVATARRIGSHENTVKYRVRRCEDLLGRPVGERSLSLAAALLLAETLGANGSTPQSLSE